MKPFRKIYAGIFFLGLFTIASHAADRQTLQGLDPAAVSRLQPIGTLPASTNLQLAIGFPLRNKSALTNLLARIYDPSDPQYHHYLTPEQFAREFGPSEQDYQTVAAFAKANGFTVTTTHPNRMLLDVTGSVADIERTLHVVMRVYQHPTEHRTFYAPDTDPSLDLTVPLLRISGLDTYSPPRPRLTAIPLSQTNIALPQSGSGPQGTYMGRDFRAAYVPGSTLTGAGQTVGLLQFDGYTPGDISNYEAVAGLPSVTLSNVLIGGFNGQPSGNGGEVEVSLDIEMAMSMAPGLSKIILYEALNPSPFNDVLNRMVTDNAAKQLSCSWYSPGGGPDPVADQIFQQMAVQGQSFLNASGDFCAWTGQIFFPGESPYITQVGGTTLTTDGAGGPWLSETVWNWGSSIGSGGGISTDYPIPTWQTNVSMAGNQGSTTMRNTPDVALTADNIYVRADGQDFDAGGTSCAAPLWAGFTALVNQQAAAYGDAPPGFLNPAIYQIGLGAGYASAFHDIATGDNTSPISPYKFFAVAGYDLCTGWGTPAGQGLIDLLTQPPPATPPSIITQPQDQTVPTASNAVFVVAATGSPVLSYQWSFNGTNIKDATNALLLLPTVVPDQAGNYSVLITNSFGAVNSSNAILTVLPPVPPVIVNQPQDQTVPFGGIALFSVTVTGTPPVFQWTFNGNPISGATNNPLIVFDVQPSNAGVYAVQVTNLAGATASSNASLSVLPPGTGCQSDAGSLVGWWAAEGNAYNAVDGTYGSLDGGINFVPGEVGQAFNFNGIDTDVQNTDPNLAVGANGFTLEAWINPSQVAQSQPLLEWALPLIPSDGLMFWISIPVLYGGAGPGSLVLDISEGPGFDNFLSTPPDIIRSNVWQHVAATYDRTSGNAALYVNGSLIAQTNAGVLTAFTPQGLWFGYDAVSKGWGPSIFGEQDRYAGQMDEILVYNRALSAAEIEAAYSAGSYGLCPIATTSVAIQPTNQTTFVGNSVTFKALPNGTAPLSYQWSLNGTNIPGATSASLSLTNVQLAQAGNYAVLAGNGAGSANSSNALLTVLPSYPAWVPTTAPVLDWTSVACSADGMKIIAVSYNGFIYTSTNFGITWISNSVPGLTWESVTCSSDGTKMAAAAVTIGGGPTGALYSSVDSGATWQLYTNGPTTILGSADGNTWIASGLGYSTNHGVSWISVPGVSLEWKACSAAANVVAGINNHQIFVSTNFGTTWNSGATLTSNDDVTQAACSSDGTRIVATVYGGYIYRSTNTGTTWAPITPYDNWQCIACSSDGSRLVTARYAGLNQTSIFTSADSGATWNPANAPAVPWGCMASSADGSKLIAAGGYPSGPIYTWQMPTLYASLSTNQLCLSWFTNAVGFTLQQNADLGTTNWLDVTNPVTVTNWFNQVIVPTSASQFYRLKYH